MDHHILNTEAQWIWADEDTEEVNQYAEFRREFYLEYTPDQACSLYISADKDYAVWLNGIFIGCGQLSDYPDEKNYDVLNVTSCLKPGKNSLCVLVYCQGEHSSTYRKGKAGLWYVLDLGGTDIISDTNTYSRISASYRNGPVPKITNQLSFVYEYDAREDDGWRLPDYTMSGSWHAAYTYQRIFDGKPASIQPRPIPKLNIKERLPVEIIAQGKFIRNRIPGAEKEQSVAQLMQTDFLSPLLPDEIFQESSIQQLPSAGGYRLKIASAGLDSGIYLILDLGREEAGLFEMELDAGAGTIVETGYGQHLEDMRVRTAVGGRNFANRYICREGRQSFTHYTTRLGGRYIQLHISNIRDPFTLYYAGLRPTEYPVKEKGEFHSPNSLWNRIYEVSIRTLHLCMHEHYEDTPWREQALYSMDSRNQALCGYYCYGEYDFPEVSFDLLGKGLGEDGYLELCAPARIPITIPCFSMAWILELADHLQYSGRTGLIKRNLLRLKYMLELYAQNRKNHLLVTPQGKRYWHFYEWADGLDGSLGTLGNGLETERFDAPLNAFYAMALDAAAGMLRAIGDHSLAEKCAKDAVEVKQAINAYFWDEKEQLFVTYKGAGCKPHYAELTQALILCAGACSEERGTLLRRKLADKSSGLVETTLSHSIYKFEAMLQEPDKYADLVFGKIEEDWGYMLYQGATSFWETIKGAADFSDAGSLCHGWSAIPVYFYQAYVLGVKPLEPGFRSFRLNPAASVLDRASGRVPTPYGDIVVGWRKEKGAVSCNVTHPKEITCIR
jgi:alpha-L-rhamnosidase